MEHPAAKNTTAAIRLLARAFISSGNDAETAISGAAAIFGFRWPWMRRLARSYLAAFSGGTCPRAESVEKFLADSSTFRLVAARRPEQLIVVNWLTRCPGMQPAPAAMGWTIPRIETVHDLADWLWLEPGDVDWFADLKALAYQSKSQQLEHYTYRLLNKRSGGVRLLETPKPRLKKAQREILAGILENVPAHPAAHAFVKGRSVASFVAPHVGQRVILRMDITDFFPSIAARRVQGAFRTMGYPERVADLLGGICTNIAPARVSAGNQEIRDLYCRPHLPQGAPTSPALANICAYRIDCRLSRLAQSAGAAYTRYADDMAFSGGGDFASRIESFSVSVAAILLEEGFHVQHRKTRIMRRGVRQHLGGLVVNDRPNPHRGDVDRLKATLTNCLRHGPESQNRDGHPAFRSHLQGRIAWVESVNPAKGNKLRLLFDQITW